MKRFIRYASPVVAALAFCGVGWIVGRQTSPAHVDPGWIMVKADQLGYLKNQVGDRELGRAFDWYVQSHEDTPDPHFELPTIIDADPTMWGWTLHAIIRGEKRLSYWSGESPLFIASTSSSGLMPCSSDGVTVLSGTSNTTYISSGPSTWIGC